MNALSAVAEARPVLWPDPVINSADAALGEACCLIERLGALIASNSADFHEALVMPGAEISSWLRRRAESIWMIYTLAGEKLGEIERLVNAIDDAVRVQPATGIGRHVANARRRSWATVVEEYRAAEAAPAEGNDADAAFDAASEAFMRMVKTRSPDLRSLQEKMCLIREARGFETFGVTDALFDDVEALARLYECNGQLVTGGEG